MRTRRERPERPPGLFGPVPVSEIFILLGLISLLVGMVRGPATGGGGSIALGVGLCAVATIEFTLREHLSGFRSHTLFIALLVTAVVHIAASLIGGTEVARSQVLLAIDAAVFAVCAMVLLRVYRRSTARS